MLHVNVLLGEYKGALLFSLDITLFHCCRQSASCTSVSALLHALSALNPAVPSIASEGETETNDLEPCTFLSCQWKPPRKRKESNLRLSDATFEKHQHSKPVKRKVSPVEDFDPRPLKFRGQVNSRLPDLLR